MSDRVFVDTNVLAYVHDLDEQPKRAIASALVDELWASGRGVVSLQVLQELYVTLTRKIRRPLPSGAAREILEDFARWEIAPFGAREVLRACEVEERHRISFWDALIVVAASAAGAAKVVTEDLNPGQEIEGVLIENPFSNARA